VEKRLVTNNPNGVETWRLPKALQILQICNLKSMLGKVPQIKKFKFTIKQTTVNTRK
jgi:hypothetical protein